MKKGDIITAKIDHIDFPNKGIFFTEDGFRVEVKNALPGQEVRVRITRKKNKTAKGNLLEIVNPSSMEKGDVCPHFGVCGGCLYEAFDYRDELSVKEDQIRRLLKDVVNKSTDFDSIFEGIKGSPDEHEYRNKMEFSFGDMEKGGELTLGMHARGGFYDIVPVENCRIVDADFRNILTFTMRFFCEKKIPYYHKNTHEGVLRHLLVRKAKKTGEILVCLVTSSQSPENPAQEKDLQGQDVVAQSRALEADAHIDEHMWELYREYAVRISEMSFIGSLAGVLHIKNDSLSDAVINEGMTILYGQDSIEEEICGLRFKISPFSFFQTNSLGAEVLYDTACEFLKTAVKKQRGMLEKNCFDLYCGTGTITQLISPVFSEVIGVEIVPEAVDAAKENAKKNGIDNCSFICGDVLKVLDDVHDRPEFIVLDPPRDGIHPKAIGKIIAYGAKSILYISCKPTSLARDLEIFEAAGYVPERIACVDMFPKTGNVETVVQLVNIGVKPD